MATLAASPHLDLVCRKCTRGASFHAKSLELAIASALGAGWQRIAADQFSCPKCSHMVEPQRAMISA